MQWETLFNDEDSAMWVLPSRPFSFELRREGEDLYTLSIETYDIPIKLATVKACSINNALFDFRHTLKDIFAGIVSDFASSCCESIIGE